MIRFSVITVCLNPGAELGRTMDSIKNQKYKDYEIILKDGLSTDGSVEAYLKDPDIKAIACADTGIYDAMNQAIDKAQGDYLIFLNCGDYLYDDEVLMRSAVAIEADGGSRGIYYGDIYDRERESHIPSAPKITPFVCYRNVPCHQACFYSRSLMEKRAYDTRYRVRADYDHFLWSYFRGEADPLDMGMTIASYQGAGYSETEKGLALSEQERQEIIGKYLTKGQIARYDMVMLLTLRSLRRKMSQSKALAGIYQGIKTFVYGKGL